MRVVSISRHEAAHLQVEEGTVVVLETPDELLDLYVLTSLHNNALAPHLRAVLLGTKIPENEPSG